MDPAFCCVIRVLLLLKEQRGKRVNGIFAADHNMPTTCVPRESEKA
jgi:hypothetical protein